MFTQLDDNKIQTPFGILSGVKTFSRHENGELRDVTLREQNMILTHAGELVPFFDKETPRRKYKPSVQFHENGLVKAVYLEDQQEIQTPIGEFPAELVTFYDTGELHRFFPLDGKITGMWSEEEERALNIPFNFDFGFAKFTAMLIGMTFFKSGDVRSMTLFPGEQIDVVTPSGKIPVRTGFSLYPNGSLESCEPASPAAVQTPIGSISAYDINAIGVNADANSLVFDPAGRVKSLITTSSRIAVLNADGVMKFITPIEVVLPDEENPSEIIPVKISFDYDTDTVALTVQSTFRYHISECKFSIFKSSFTAPSCSPSDCASCSICGG
ncbi:MAG: hypothetical protein QM689_06180 [Oscillospiraceae bacterium]